MDHEFSSGQLQDGQVGWDWFSIQLKDGREVMLYRMRQSNGSTTPQSSGSLIEHNGAVQHLSLRAFSIVSSAIWRSPHTQAIYPSGWVVRVAGIGAPLQLTPVLLDQELVGAQKPTYWEGAVDVRDARTQRSLGVGYVELTGYASPVRL
jgi:predicted secreted hydrolase